MIEVKRYRDLKVWQKSMDLLVICYQLFLSIISVQILRCHSQLI